MVAPAAKTRLAQAMRDMQDRGHERRHVHSTIATVASVGSNGMSVVTGDHGFAVDPDELLVSHAVAQYDVDYGIEKGDSVVLAPLVDGTYVAVAVMSGEDATARRWDGLVIYGTAAPTSGVGRNLDFYIQTGPTADDWKIYGPKLAGAWPAGIGLRGPQGPAGTNGTNGSNFLVGAGAPAAGTGANGDFYMDRLNGYTYGPKAAGAWPAPSGPLLLHPLLAVGW